MRSILLIPLCAAMPVLAQVPQWAFPLDGAGSEDVQQIAAGPDGSVTVVGRLGAAMDMDPGPSTAMLDPGSSDDPSYVARYSGNGQLEWAFALLQQGADAEARVEDIAVASNGATYLAISLRGTVQLSPNGTPVVVTATSLAPGYTNASDLVLAAYDTDGNYAWHKWIQGDGARLEGPMHLTVRGQDDVLISGGYYGAIDLDQDLNGPADSLQAANVNAVAFLAQYSATGSFQWALDFDGACSIHGLADLMPGIAIGIHPFNDISTFDLNPGPGALLEDSDSDYLILLDANVDLIFTLEIGCSMGHAFQEMIRTGPGDVAWVGAFEGIVTVGDSAYNNGTGPSHAYVAQLNLMPFSLWSRYVPLQTSTYSLASRGDGTFQTGLELNDALDPDGGAGPATPLIPVGDDLAIVQYNSLGDVQFAWQIGTASDDLGSPSIAMDPAGDLFLGAQMHGTVDVFPGAGVLDVIASDGQDGGLLVKYGEIGTRTDATPPEERLMLWPNPAEDRIWFDPPWRDGAVHWMILDSKGATAMQGRCITTSAPCAIDLSGLCPGAYALRATGAAHRAWSTVVVR